MAERAHTAKEAIDIAIKLLGEYGYFSEGRTYTVADKRSLADRHSQRQHLGGTPRSGQ